MLIVYPIGGFHLILYRATLGDQLYTFCLVRSEKISVIFYMYIICQVVIRKKYAIHIITDD